MIHLALRFQWLDGAAMQRFGAFRCHPPGRKQFQHSEPRFERETLRTRRATAKSA